jgi:DNA-directed RNA polymerase II subunit RPB1
MHLIQNNYDQEMVEEVDEVVLGVWNPQEILNGSVCEVLTSETYDNTRPKVNGLFDLRMGTIEQGFTCETCHQDYRGCPGHFGHIKLARPVYHMQFMKYMLKIARCFCYVCSECLVPISEEVEWKKIKSKPFKTRFQYILKEYKNAPSMNTCRYCNSVQPLKYINPRNSQENTHGIAKVYAEFTGPAKEKKYISCEQMLEFLKKIKSEDLDKIGIPSDTSRPDWMICTIFPVPPPHVRPSVRQENNQKSEDDLTHKLAEIIIRNQTLREEFNKAGSSGSSTQNRSSIIDDWTQVLQYHVSTFIDNEIPGIPKAIQRSGRPIKALKQRLQAKDGRMRYNLMGKRGDYTARTVITAEPNIALDELGIPKKIAMNLTFPEIVNKNNIDRLRQNVLNGVSVYPGAKSIIKRIKKANGNVVYNQFSLSMVPIKGLIEPKIGDIVHRHLQDGDLVFFNRQPSLHKMSMMGHRVRVLEVGNTFRLNVSATTPYNADFDGDEMNVFLTQCMEGIAELKYLTLVENQIVSPQRNQCVITLVQDTLFCCPLITNEDCKIALNNYMNLLLFIGKEDYDIPRNMELTGRSLFDLIIPKINMNRSTIISDIKRNSNINSEKPLRIVDGKIVQGVVDKKTVGSSAGGIIHVLWKDYNPRTSADFIYKCQKLCTQWLLNVGHSMGVSDTLFLNEDLSVAEAKYTEIHDIIYSGVCEAKYLIDLAKKGLYKTRSDKDISEDIESEIMFILNQARDKTTTTGVKDFVINQNKGNRLMKMVLAGSKGDLSNVAQIMCVFGQAEVAGTRSPLYFTNRSLPHYPKYDNSPEARGFVKHSFKDGLDPNEFYFLASSTRVGLIDKTVKTADTGYTQRRLIKSMEDLMVHYDGSVRTANNSILQFGYGDDFFEATFLETLRFEYHKMSDKDFRSKFLISKENIDEYNELFELKQIIKSQMGINTEFYSPCNISRLLQEIINQRGNSSTYSPITLEVVFQGKKDLDDFLVKYFVGSDGKIPKEMFMFRNYYTFELSWPIMSKTEGISIDIFQILIKNIKDKFILSVCPSGEMVGIICGQSIGEPTTQMTLNTFHHIGGGKNTTTTGVPRMKELLAVSKKIKTPSMVLYLKNGLKKDFEYQEIRDYSLRFEYTKLSDILNNLDVFFEINPEDPYDTIYELDKDWLSNLRQVYTANPKSNLAAIQKLSWVIRLDLNKIKYTMIGITIEDIERAIQQNLIMQINSKKSQTQIISNYQIIFNDEQDVIRIYISIQDGESQNNWNNIYKIVDKYLVNIKLKGIEGISSVTVDTQKSAIIYKEDGSIIEEEEYVLYCSGSKLRDVIMFKDSVYKLPDSTRVLELDKSRLKSNDVQEMYEVYGIELARYSLIEEFRNVLESTGGVNLRHITILVDTMTSKGQMIPIDRHGVKKNEIGPLSRATFEETVDQLLKAATFGEVDSMNGVSANIMMGQLAPCGTGTVSLLLDEVKVLSSKSGTGKLEDSTQFVNNSEIESVQNIITKISSNKRTERTERTERTDRTDRTDRTERTDRTDRTGQPIQLEIPIAKRIHISEEPFAHFGFIRQKINIK